MKAMKAIYIAAAVIAPLALTGCADEEHVDATANRTGITSLTAYFTSGPNIDKAAVKYQPTGDATQTDYVIPVPYYYPEESDNTTEEYMTKMKVVAKVENNCTIDPPITVLDLTQKNHFTYTNPYGEKQDITISGQLTRSDKCQLKAITVQPGDLTGIIDEDAKTVSLVTAADLSAATATATLSAHATISPDPAQPHDMNNGFEFTVTADNGTSKAGYRAGSETKVFENDMTTIAGIDWNNSHPTLAATKAHVILDPGTGATPFYFSKTTGQQIGQIALGSANASGCVTSDDKGNMLICNLAASGQKLNIYKTDDVTKAPELFISYDNGLGVDIGARLQVYGDLNGDAVVTATPLNCQNAIRWIVKDGKVGQPELRRQLPRLLRAGLDHRQASHAGRHGKCLGLQPRRYRRAPLQRRQLPRNLRDWLLARLGTLWPRLFLRRQLARLALGQLQRQQRTAVRHRRARPLRLYWLRCRRQICRRADGSVRRRLLHEHLLRLQHPQVVWMLADRLYRQINVLHHEQTE